MPPSSRVARTACATPRLARARPTLVALLLLAACLEPGVRATGEGTVALVGTSEVRLAGPCALSAEPGWGIETPWVVRWTDVDSKWTLLLRTDDRPEPGERTLDLPGEGRIRTFVTAMEGSGVRGVASGTARTRRAGDTLVFEVRGRIDHRERWEVRAECRAVEGAGA